MPIREYVLGNGKTYRKEEPDLLECPVCHQSVDLLYGEDAGGGVKGCEKCWKPPTKAINQTAPEIDIQRDVV